MDDKFFTIDDLAKVMRVDRRTIARLIKEGSLLAVNVGKEKRPTWRIYEGQYLKFIADSYEKQTMED